MSFYQLRTDSSLMSVPETDLNAVFDIDETLVHTFEEAARPHLQSLGLMEDPLLMYLRSRLYVLPLVDLSRTGDNSMNLYWGIMRPGLKNFLRFSLKYFNKVCIWSAGHRDYVEKVCTNIFRGTDGPSVIFSSNDCDKIGSHNIKPLSKMFNHPNCVGMTPENTIVIDDRASTFSQNPLNGIQIPAYLPEETIDGMSREELSLRKLTDWLLLDEVIKCTDIRNLDKSVVFGLSGAKSPRTANNY